MLRGWKKKPDIDIQDSQGWTALHIACSEGHFSIILFLLEHQANVNLPNYDGATPIFYLVRKKTADSKILFDQHLINLSILYS